MANHLSAIKRARQNVKRRLRNEALLAKTKTEAKKVSGLIGAAKTREEAIKALEVGQKVFMKAASKGIFPKERASRHISRLALALNKKFSGSVAA